MLLTSLHSYTDEEILRMFQAQLGAPIGHTAMIQRELAQEIANRMEGWVEKPERKE